MEDNDVYVEEEEGLQSFLPQGFGKPTRETDVAAQIARTKRQQAVTSLKDAKTGSDSVDSSDDEDDDSEDEDEFPVSHELVFKTHDKAVTTITADTSGARLITGSNDCTLKFHDFASLTPNTLRAFKSVEPEATKNTTSSETHPIRHVSFNPVSPAQILVVSSQSQARIFSRDGEPLVEFIKGDMYLRDMHNTKGHVSEITSGAWHPTNRDLCVTAGTDSTVRIWDVNVKRTQRDVIVYKSRASGSAGRTRMTAVAWGSAGGGENLLAASLDGSLVMWPKDGPFSRPAGEIRNAHTPDTWTSSVAISPDGRTAVSRGGDNTLKLWDLRKFKAPVSSVEHASTSSNFPNSNVCYSPSGSAILVGSATGHLHILNPATLNAELVTLVTPNSPLITVMWHAQMNQIITGSANAETHVLYSPSLSSHGAAMVMSKAPKRRHIDDDPSRTIDQAEGISGDAIITPHGLLKSGPGAGPSGKNRDPRRPHIPATTPFAKSQPDEAHIKTNIPLSSMRDEDPREALLKYAEKASKDPIFTKAWQDTQPKAIFRELSDDEDEEPDKKKARKA